MPYGPIKITEFHTLSSVAQCLHWTVQAQELTHAMMCRGRTCRFASYDFAVHGVGSCAPRLHQGVSPCSSTLSTPSVGCSAPTATAVPPPSTFRSSHLRRVQSHYVVVGQPWIPHPPVRPVPTAAAPLPVPVVVISIPPVPVHRASPPVRHVPS